MTQIMTLAQTAQSVAPRNGEAIDDSVLTVIGLGILGVLVLMLFTVVVPTMVHMRNERERERTRREIAAYAAEGSITPEEATEMMKAAHPTTDCFGRRS